MSPVNLAEPQRRATAPQGPDSTQAYAAELDALARRLDTDRADLEPLLGHLLRKQVPGHRIPGLLGQAHARLERLRARSAEDVGLAAGQPGVAALVEQAQVALQADEGPALEAADQALVAALEALGEPVGDASRLGARLHADRAEIAALRQQHRRAADLYARAAATAGLPEASRWRYQHARAAVLEELGRELGENPALEEAIDLYETTVLTLAPRTERPDDWATTQHGLGNALGVLGQRQRGVRLLERAITAFENALAERSRQRAPLAWAATQHSLGNALGVLAQRSSDVEMLKRAVDVLRGALEVRTREAAPSDWAVTQNSLGTALLTLGQLEHDTQVLEQSVDAYRRVLQEWTRERAPLDWATTQYNLGTALRVLGEQRKDAAVLEEAVAACRSALAERNRERAPQDWAMTQNNLGAALQKLGEHEGDARTLSRAIEAYQNALAEWRRERHPMAWAMTTANLGLTRRTLAELARDVDMARQAIGDFEAVAEVFEAVSHAQYHQLAKEQLAIAREVAEELGA